MAERPTRGMKSVPPLVRGSESDDSDSEAQIARSKQERLERNRELQVAEQESDIKLVMDQAQVSHIKKL
jgi:NACalpha-BTF3-like transcription factor